MEREKDRRERRKRRYRTAPLTTNFNHLKLLLLSELEETLTHSFPSFVIDLPLDSIVTTNLLLIVLNGQLEIFAESKLLIVNNNKKKKTIGILSLHISNHLQRSKRQENK